MTDIDFSSPEHRLANIAGMKFTAAYARVRHHVWAMAPGSYAKDFLMPYMGEMEKQIAEQLDIPQYMLVGTLVDLGYELCVSKTAKDEAESGEG